MSPDRSSVNEIKQMLKHISEQRKLIKVINKTKYLKKTEELM